MPYILISTQIRLETGPTNVGDEFSDPAVMNYLGARKTTVLGNNFSEYHVEEPPRLVLDKLEKIGFRVLSMTGVGQTLVWCLHKEAEGVMDLFARAVHVLGRPGCVINNLEMLPAKLRADTPPKT